jgi:hypothetical protein
MDKEYQDREMMNDLIKKQLLIDSLQIAITDKNNELSVLRKELFELKKKVALFEEGLKATCFEKRWEIAEKCLEESKA